jgi:hypothetical protein
MILLIAAILAQEHPKTPEHTSHVRPFAEILAQIEKARAERGSFKAAVAVMRSEGSTDSTVTSAGTLAVRVDEKKIAMLSASLPAARLLHDGSTVTVTDSAERVYSSGGAWTDPRFFAAELILHGGRGLEKHFTVRVTSDPWLAKNERGNKGKIEDDLENPVGPCHVELTPIDPALAKRLRSFTVDFDPVTLLPVTIKVSTDDLTIAVVLRDVVKVEAKELADDLFKLDLAGLTKE